jgi:GNAT superfamily N-acetyltransferase
MGFLAGATDKHAIFDFPFYCYSLYLALLQLLVCPSNLKSMIRYAKRQRLHKERQCDAELLTMAVAAGYQKKGLGGRLVEAFEDFLKGAGVKQYEVYTDTEKNTAYVFYEKCGFLFAWDVIFMNSKSAVYQKSIG